jgi:hypothetical protein
MTFDQGEFDFEAFRPEDGYRHWKVVLDEEKRAFESRWGIILGRPVRLKLRSRDEPLEGIVNLVSGEERPRGASLRLSLKGFVFTPKEIESVMRLEEESRV